MWMVRAGENGFLIDDFKQDNIIAIGWEIGDLSDKTRDEIKQIMREYYPNANNKSLGNNSGQVIKFVLDFQIGDYVITYNPKTTNYLVGIIKSDYYCSDKLYKKYNEDETFYHHFRDVEWIGETNKGDLKEIALKPLKNPMTVFNLNYSAKADLLTKMNWDKIEWPKYYMEFADKLLEYKNDRPSLIDKVFKVFSAIGLNVPRLENDEHGNSIRPYDIDPFTIFAFFNKQIATENRINFVREFKKEFSLKSEPIYTFHGISLVNNLKATFYGFDKDRKEDDIDNLWELFEIALNYSKDNREEFIRTYDKVRGQYAILWNITMALNWIRPYDFINLDANNREILSTDDIFAEEFRNEIKSLNAPPSAKQYLHICEECKRAINESEKYDNFPLLSHSAYINKINSDNDESDEGIGDSDVKTTRYWLISPGSGADWWDDFYQNGEIGIGFNGTGDLSQYKSKEELKQKFQEMTGDKSSHRNNVHACWQFVHDIQIGDVIFAKNGMSEIIGRGIVEGDYEYDAIKPYHKLRKVKWTHRGHWEPKDKLPMKTLTDITNYTEFVNDIKELFVSDENDEDEVPEIQYPEYTYEKFLEEVYISENDYNTLVDLVKNKKNLIVEGAPGVGKTFMAKRLAYSIMGVKDASRVMMVQFHQSYSYEDFVMGYRPSKVGFELRQGSFYNFCKKAEEDSENDYFFIIDEINRGNLSKIFGELFMLIENDKRGEKNKIQLLYSDELFFIPKNIYIIGLMNTADRSLAMIDYALRRRFAFFDLKPGFASNGFKDYQNELENAKFDKLINVMNELNSDIKDDECLGEGFRIGHSYLCNLKTDDIDDKLNYIVEYELIPLLKEYWFDEQGKVDEWAARLRSAVNDS